MSLWCLQILPKTNKKVNLRYHTVQWLSWFFFHFLEELRIPKSPFEINWPLPRFHVREETKRLYFKIFMQLDSRTLGQIPQFPFKLQNILSYFVVFVVAMKLCLLLLFFKIWVFVNLQALNSLWANIGQPLSKVLK